MGPFKSQSSRPYHPCMELLYQWMCCALIEIVQVLCAYIVNASLLMETAIQYLLFYAVTAVKTKHGRISLISLNITTLQIHVLVLSGIVCRLWIFLFMQLVSRSDSGARELLETVNTMPAGKYQQSSRVASNTTSTNTKHIWRKALPQAKDKPPTKQQAIQYHHSTW